MGLPRREAASHKATEGIDFDQKYQSFRYVTLLTYKIDTVEIDLARTKG